MYILLLLAGASLGSTRDGRGAGEVRRSRRASAESCASDRCASDGVSLLQLHAAAERRLRENRTEPRSGSSSADCARGSISILRALTHDPAGGARTAGISFGSKTCSIQSALECLPTSLEEGVTSGCDVAFGAALRARLRDASGKGAGWDQEPRSCGQTPGKQIHFAAVANWRHAKTADPPRLFRFSANSPTWIKGADFKDCAAQGLDGFDCFFRPADKAEEDASEDERHSAQRFRVAPELVDEALHRWADVPPTAQLLLFSQLTRLIFNRSPAFVSFYEKARKSVEHVRPGGPAVALHVRRGDACGREREIQEAAGALDLEGTGDHRHCFATKVYAEKLQTVKEMYGATEVYLATTEMAFLEELQSDFADLYASLNWHFLDFDHGALDSKSGEWYEIRDDSERSRIGPGSYADLWHLSNGDVFVGHLASHFSRSAWQLGMGRKGRLIPYVSVDGRSPCCDITEQCSAVQPRTMDECLSWLFSKFEGEGCYDTPWTQV